MEQFLPFMSQSIFFFFSQSRRYYLSRIFCTSDLGSISLWSLSPRTLIRRCVCVCVLSHTPSAGLKRRSMRLVSQSPVNTPLVVAVKNIGRCVCVCVFDFSRENRPTHRSRYLHPGGCSSKMFVLVGVVGIQVPVPYSSSGCGARVDREATWINGYPGIALLRGRLPG